MPEACFMVEAFFKDHTSTQIRDEGPDGKHSNSNQKQE